MPIDRDLTTELTRLEYEWFGALRDREWASAQRYMRGDFTITTAGWIDEPIGADAWLESFAGRYRLDHFDYDEVVVRRYGDVAIVQCRSHQSGTFLDSGEEWAESFRYTDVWVRDPQLGWQIAVRHAGIRRKRHD